MKQCLLKKGDTVDIAWIDVDKAAKGKYVDIKREDGYDKNWLVVEVYDTEFSKEWIAVRGKDYIKMKRMTDV